MHLNTLWRSVLSDAVTCEEEDAKAGVLMHLMVLSTF